MITLPAAAPAASFPWLCQAQQGPPHGSGAEQAPALQSHGKRGAPARVARPEAAEATARGLSPSVGDVGHSFQVPQPLQGRGQLLLCTEHVI